MNTLNIRTTPGTIEGLSLSFYNGSEKMQFNISGYDSCYANLTVDQCRSVRAFLDMWIKEKENEKVG